jgi:hypothetical protein
MSEQRNFISLALAGKVTPDQIDDYVGKWHDSSSRLELHEYLGLTREEYGLWLGDPDQLLAILANRKSDISAVPVSRR